ncbi:hypothetical protein ACVWXM_006301 [Bradyrhizobium sp. GM7.3]
MNAAPLSAEFLPDRLGAGGGEHIAPALPPVAEFGPVNPLRDKAGGGNEYNSNDD